MVTGAPKDLRHLALAAGALLVLACGHTEPFSAPPYGTNQPFDPTPPVRLTLNTAADRGASWLPGGTGILYSAQQLGRPDADVCLAELPPGGGSQRRLVCDPLPADEAVTNAFESPVAAPDGRLAFVAARASVGGANPSSLAISIAPGLDAANATIVQRVPYTLAGEPTHSGVTQLRWQDENRLVYLAELSTTRQTCRTCILDTVETGLKVALLDLATPGTPPVALSGTDFASGVSPGSTSDEIYFTINGDSRVFRRVLSSGDQSVAHDFGAAGVARDVHVADGRLTAIVGGRVHVVEDSILGQVQWDSGGIVHVVDRASDADVALAADLRLFRRAVLSPTGDRVVAEGYPVTVRASSEPGLADTTVSRAGDLYLFVAP
jgi:hypothetical protein